MLDSGKANVFASNDAGDTALTIAARHRHGAVESALRKVVKAAAQYERGSKRLSTLVA